MAPTAPADSAAAPAAGAIPVRWQRLAAISAITFAFAHNLWLSWLKWGDGLIDCGRDIDAARQLALGKHLYSDVRYLFGPLAPEINQALFRVFGVHLNTLLAAGIATTALACWVLYRLMRQFTGRTGAVIIVIGFQYVCAFAHTMPIAIFNFVLPYSYAATYGALLALASLFFLVRYARKEKARDFYLAAACLALVALTKVEIVFGSVVLHAAFLVAAMTTRRFRWQVLVLGYGAALLFIALIYGYFINSAGWQVFYDNVVFQLFAKGENKLNRAMMGFDNVSAACMHIAGSLAAAAMLAGVAIAAERISRPSRLAILCAVAAGAGLGIYRWLDFDYSLACLNVVGAAVCLYWAVAWFRRPALRAEMLPHLLMWVYGTACLARLGLRVMSPHYGFFLLPGGLAAYGLLWFRYLPEWLGRPASGKGAGRVFQFAGAGIFAALIWNHLQLSSAAYALHTVDVSAPRGHLRMLDQKNKSVGSACSGLVKLLGQTAPGTSVMVLPQGSQLTFLAQRDNPIGQFGFTPTEFNSTYSDDALLATMQATPPDLIVIVNLEMNDVNDARMGVDYMQKTAQWIEQSYSPVAHDKENVMAVYARKNLNSTPQP